MGGVQQRPTDATPGVGRVDEREEEFAVPRVDRGEAEHPLPGVDGDQQRWIRNENAGPSQMLRKCR